MKAKRKYRSWFRFKELGWTKYSGVQLWVRGDGRKYRLNIHTKADYDIEYHDLWTAYLYTRGGPYWQYVKVFIST